MILIPVASVYLAFTSYFGAAAAWSLETAAVLAFAVLGSLGTRWPVALISGYVLHGVRDLLHELHAHGAADVFGGLEATRVPLAYGAFCLTYDVAMAACFIIRSGHWSRSKA